MTKRKKSNPRVTAIRPNGGVTLAGLHYGDLRSILTSAALYTYDELAKHRDDPGHAHDCQECTTWRTQHLALIQAAEGSLKSAIADTHGPRRPPTSIPERRRAVESARRERILIESLLDDMIAERDRRKR